MPVERITKEQLKERLDRGEKPTILDVRLKYAYEHSTVKLPGAIRVPPYAIDSVPIPSGGDIVAYDSDPNELVSTHVAAELLQKGHQDPRPQRRCPGMAGRQLSHRNERSATLGSARTRLPERLIAVAAAAVAFLCYYATLLPGLDLGDSASFQTGVGSLTLTPRQAYPLYYGLGNLFVWLHPGEPARAMNLASAVYGAVAVGLATLLAARLTRVRARRRRRRTVSGVLVHLLVAGDHGRGLHAPSADRGRGIAGRCWRWAERPTVAQTGPFLRRLRARVWQPPEHGAVAAGIRRVSSSSPPSRTAADPLRPRMIALAVGIAAVAALQYAWNFRGLWASSSSRPPRCRRASPSSGSTSPKPTGARRS